MARSTFGGFGGDQVSLDPAGNSGFYKAAANLPASGTFWSASTGGTQWTDLVDPGTGVALAGVSTDAHGHVIPFKGPDGIVEGWVDFGGGRFKLTAVDSGIFLTPTGLDSASANLVTTPGSATDTALKGGYAPQWKPSTAYTAGQSVVNPYGDVVSAVAAFTSGASYNPANWVMHPSAAAPSVIVPLVTKLDQRQASATMVVLGDSTGVPPTTGKWVDSLAASIGVKWPACKTTNALWGGTSYPAPTTVATGVISKTSASDTFTRTSADLIGSTPDTGGVWVSSSSGKYTVDGSKALFTNGGTGVTAQRLPVTTPGRLKTSVNLTCIYDGGAHSGTYQVLSSYIDGSNFFWIQATLNGAGSSIAFKVSTTAGGTVTAATLTGAQCGLSTNLSAQTIPFSIEHTVNGTVIFTCGTGTSTYTLAAGDDTTFATSGAQGGFWSQVNDHSWDNITITTASPPSTTLAIYNGSVSSTKADYPLTRIPAMLPVAPDVVFISYGHNHTTDSPATFQTALDTLVTAIHGQWPGVPIVIVGQNPEKSPATNAAYHLLREQSKRAYAKSKGYGYLAAFEAFQGQNFPGDFIQSDGVHPSTSGPNDGGGLWATTAQNYLNSVSLKP
jgi:lysophospholipase L1-like esterase